MPQLFAEDAITRARELTGYMGGGTGCYSHSQVNPKFTCFTRTKVPILTDTCGAARQGVRSIRKHVA